MKHIISTSQSKRAAYKTHLEKIILAFCFKRFILVAMVSLSILIQQQVSAEPIIFKSSGLSGRVQEALTKAKENDLSYVDELMEIYRKDTSEVFREMEKHIKSEDEDVKFAIITAASYVRTPKSLQVLIKLVPDNEVGHIASRTIFDQYDSDQVASKGDLALKRALIRNFINNRYSTHTTLLLSCFKDNAIAEIMNRRRKSYASTKRNASEELILIDVALSNLGFADASARIKKVFVERQTANILTVLLYIRYVKSKVILNSVVSLLGDKGKARMTGLSHGPETYTRLCDEALLSLRVRFDKSAPTTYGISRPFTDAELAAAREKYKARVTALK